MAWTTAHFAVGMAGSATLAAVVCAILRRGWRTLPWIMTLGGIWALIPDLNRIWTEDFPNLPGHAIADDKIIVQWLNDWGDLFFFHRMMDNQPHEYALHGLVAILLMYNAVFLGHWLEHRRMYRKLRRLEKNLAAREHIQKLTRQQTRPTANRT